MARVLLLSPPYLDLYGSLRAAAGRYFPLGLGYVASHLRDRGGHDLRMFEPEAQRLSLDDIAAVVKSYRPEVVGITCATPNYPRAVALAKLCRERSHARIVLGGVHGSAMPELVVESHRGVFDCVVVGEGEQTMLELVDAWERGGTIEGIRGIVHERDGRAVRTPPRPLLDDLDRLSPPARDLIPQDLFAPNMHNARHRACVTMLTSRGCPFNCTFCAARVVSGKKYRMHSAEYVIEEMKRLKADHGARQLLITDDTFTLHRERLERICRAMIREKLRLTWFCFSQVTGIDAEILRLMKQAGCYSIGFGIESADEAVLKAMGKHITPAKAKQAVHLANAAGLKTQAFYILGSPGETREQMARTIAFSREVDATLTFYNMLVPYPGTRDFEYFFGGVPPSEIDWEDFVAVGERCVLKRSTVPPDEIQKLIATANTRYYARPAKLLDLARHVRTPYELGNYVRGGVSLARQIIGWSAPRKS